MEIRAYDEAYLASARNILGHAADFAIMTLNLNPDDFGKALMVSGKHQSSLLPGIPVMLPE